MLITVLHDTRVDNNAMGKMPQRISCSCGCRGFIKGIPNKQEDAQLLGGEEGAIGSLKSAVRTVLRRGTA
jgi:hypothetical protein